MIFSKNIAVTALSTLVLTAFHANSAWALDFKTAYEAALQDNHQIHNVKQPIEIQRTIHSFDPCIACAVHVSDPESGEQVEIKIV